MQESEDGQMEKWFLLKKKQDAQKMAQLGNMMEKSNASLLSGLKEIFQPILAPPPVTPPMPPPFPAYYQGPAYHPGMQNPNAHQ